MDHALDLHIRKELNFRPHLWFAHLLFIIDCGQTMKRTRIALVKQQVLNRQRNIKSKMHMKCKGCTLFLNKHDGTIGDIELHLRRSPNCKLLRNLLKKESIRLKTFNKWPFSHIHSGDKLAKAGFYYAIKYNILLCAFCHVKLCNLKKDDDIMKIHENLAFSACKYINCLKTKSLKATKKLSPFLKLKKKSCLILADSSDQYRCKICFEEKLDVLFIPCNHIITCSKCSSKLSQCPVCREDIVGSITVYIA